MRYFLFISFSVVLNIQLLAFNNDNTTNVLKNSLENAAWSGKCRVYLSLLEFKKVQNTEFINKTIDDFLHSESIRDDIPVPALLEVCPKFIDKFNVTIEMLQNNEQNLHQKYLNAVENTKSSEGYIFDKLLSEAVGKIDNFQSKMTNCITNSDGAKSVKGVFEFIKKGSYRVLLEPKSEFSACFAQLLENQEMPMPPTFPYVNPIGFEIEE